MRFSAAVWIGHGIDGLSGMRKEDYFRRRIGLSRGCKITILLGPDLAYATTHSLSLRTTDAGASTSNSTAPSLYFRE